MQGVRVSGDNWNVVGGWGFDLLYDRITQEG